MPYDSPLERTREIVDICRRVWRHEVLTNDGIYKIPLPAGREPAWASRSSSSPTRYVPTSRCGWRPWGRRTSS